MIKKNIRFETIVFLSTKNKKKGWEKFDSSLKE